MVGTVPLAMNPRGEKRPLRRRVGWSGPPTCILLLLLAAGVRPAAAQDRLQFERRPVAEVIREIELATPWRFLYRDALVSGRSVTFESTPDRVVEDLADALETVGLTLASDAGRHQVLVIPHEPDRPPARRLRGRVRDSASGAPLPFATVSWLSEGQLRGVVSDAAGQFEIVTREAADTLSATASFVGYHPLTVRVPTDGSIPEVTFPLEEQPIIGSEVLVSASVLVTELDTSWVHLLRPGVVAPLGESGLMRSLQVLPAVSISTAMSDGPTVRGSRADGFQVLLDGMPVYSREHLFGLFDAFNDDALQTVGLFYGVAPAGYQAPPGGTVSMVTRSGNARAWSGNAGIGASAVRGTVEGPLLGGSWLVSGRRSYLGAVDWLGSTDLIAMGLDLGRRTGELPSGTALPGGFRLLSDPDAAYYDAHARYDRETASGARISWSAYAGGDEAAYEAERLLPGVRRPNGTFVIHRVDAGTSSRWGSATTSLQARVPVERGLVSALAGFSRYGASYRKEDFVYAGREWAPGNMPGPGNGAGGAPLRRVAPLSNESRLAQGRMGVDWTVASRAGGAWTVGLAADAYGMRLEENSLGRSDYFLERDAVQVDAYGSFSLPRGSTLGGDLGLRVQTWSGRQAVLSPRATVRLFEGGRVTATAGYSRNHQFLHRISVENEGYTDLWILADPDEAPTRVDYVTLGLQARPGRGFAVSVEGYVKDYRNVRLHETVAEARGLVTGGLLGRPWLNDAGGSARGLEVLLRASLPGVLLTQGYAWSRAELEHPMVQSGRRFPAPWDRTHQGTFTVQAGRGETWSVAATWMVASGLPNALRFVDPAEVDRLPVYHRLDLSVQAGFRSRPGTFSLRLGVFNAYDRNNTWYRAAVPTVTETGMPGATVQTVAVDVYDLGLQPSFELRYRVR